MKVGLINPPCTYGPNPVNLDLICLNGIANIGAELKRAGHEVKVADYVHNPKANLYDVSNCDVVGITSTISSYRFLKEYLPWLKEWGKTIIVGGPLISSYGPRMTGPHIVIANNVLMREFPEIDYGVIGEGDRSIVGLVDWINKTGHVPGGVIRGVRSTDGEINFAGMGPEEVVQNLDDLAEIDWNDWSHMRDMAKGKTFNIMLSRGCYNQCSFCYKPQKGVRSFSLERAKKEIEKAAALKPRMVSFGDDVFAYDKDRAIELVRFTQDLGFPYIIETRLQDLDDGLLKVLKETGCQQVQVGVESFDDEVLRRAGKNQTVAEIYEGIARVQKAGVELSAFILVGLPGETRRSIDTTINAVKKTGIRARPRIVMPLPGTRLYQEALDHGMFDETQMLKSFSEPEHYDSVRGNWVPLNFTYVPDSALIAARDEIREIGEERFGVK